MAPTATIHRLAIELSDVDRNVYETLDLRMAQHPSETVRYMLTRALAYCLEYEEGIAFSKAGLSDADEPPLAVRDPTGVLIAWIDVGVPSAERLHRASKAARRVAVYTSADLSQLRREAASRTVHRVEAIDVWRLDPTLLADLEARMDRTTKLSLTRTDGQIYLHVGGATLESSLTRASLVE